MELTRKQEDARFARWVKEFWSNSTNLYKNFFIYNIKIYEKGEEQ